jgi:amidophosphoribosyltransferase
MSAEQIGEKCGVFGIYTPGHQASRLTHAGIFTLQHRGQESAGIASSDGEQIYIHKDMGLVTHVFDEKIIENLVGFIGIGHTRYSTSEGSTSIHAQPVMRSDGIMALAHNGNLPSTTLLTEFLRDKGLPIARSNDSEMMADAIGYYLRRGTPLDESIIKAYPLFTGAFSMVVMTQNEIAAVRDGKGIRPFSIGKLNGGYVFASETCALDVIHAQYIGDVNPGEMIILNHEGIHRHQIVPGEQKLDLFEFVYFSRPDSVHLGKRVYEVRRNFGQILAEESPVDADVVIPVPDSAIPAAIGFSRFSGIPYDEGLIKNRYIHRTFIEPDQRMRDSDIEMKLNPISEVINNKRVVIIDDSIVRGSTLGKLVRMLKRVGAKEVHVRISSSPVIYPDHYGIDTPKQEKLIAARLTVPEICQEIGADSLNYLSFNGMIRATGLPEEVFNTSCFTGNYPIDIRERAGEIVRFPSYA